MPAVSRACLTSTFFFSFHFENMQDVFWMNFGVGDNSSDSDSGQILNERRPQDEYKDGMWVLPHSGCSQSNFDYKLHSNGALVSIVFIAHFCPCGKQETQLVVRIFGRPAIPLIWCFFFVGCWNLGRCYRNSCKRGLGSCLRWHLRSCGHGWAHGVQTLLQLCCYVATS
jgi:hypothetical protein